MGGFCFNERDSSPVPPDVSGYCSPLENADGSAEIYGEGGSQTPHPKRQNRFVVLTGLRRFSGRGGLKALRFRAKWEHLETFSGLLPRSSGQDVALTVSSLPHSLDRGPPTLKQVGGF